MKTIGATSKRNKTNHKNTANFPVMSVANSPKINSMERILNILPGNVSVYARQGLLLLTNAGLAVGAPYPRKTASCHINR